MLLAIILLGALAAYGSAFVRSYHVVFVRGPQYSGGPPHLSQNNMFPPPPHIVYPAGGYDPDLRPPPPPPPGPPQYVWSGNYKPPLPPAGWYPPQQPPEYNQVPIRPMEFSPTRPPQLSSTPKPSEVMADVVNLLAERILLDHVSARGNFVFSPYGVTSVLCVLWEGSTGATSRQIATALTIPPEPELVRIGMRDMHRHLKSYFGHNGYLQGVELSEGNQTSLRDNFQPIFNIYGYHMDYPVNSTTPQTGVVNANTTMAPGDSAGQESNSQGSNTQAPPPPEEAGMEEITLSPDEDQPPTEEQQNTEVTTVPMDPSTSPQFVSEQTTSDKPPMLSSETPVPEANGSSSTEAPSSNPSSSEEPGKAPDMTSTSAASSPMSSEVSTSSPMAQSESSTSPMSHNESPSSISIENNEIGSTTAMPQNEVASTGPMSHNEIESSSPMSHNEVESSSPTSHNEVESSSPTSHNEVESSSPMSHNEVESSSPMSHNEVQSTMSPEATSSYAPLEHTDSPSETHTVTSLPDEASTITTIDELTTQSSTLQPEEQTDEAPQPPADYNNEEEQGARRKRQSNDKNVLFPDIALSSGRENLTDVSEDVEQDTLAPRRRFRLYTGSFTRPVPVLERRGELLPFASLPGLRAIAAMLPLDDPRYGLLVLLPTDGRGPALKQLAADMTQVPLRRVLQALRISRLHVTLPKFAARGPVVLTSSLQQLGVWDLFDPRLARLNRMSTDPGLYVRELEQNVRVDFGSVRNVNTRVITARSTAEVVDLMRPFLYFVMDREMQTCLLAGKVEDPSTPRIF